jgi:hypothetical protein
MPVSTPSREAATRVWLVLWKAARAIEQNAIRSVSASGLGLSDFALLEELLHKGPQPVNIIGRKFLLTSGSITAAVDRLESRKLLPEDRRLEGPAQPDRPPHRGGAAFHRASLPKTCNGQGGNHGRMEIRGTSRTGPLAQKGRKVASCTA